MGWADLVVQAGSLAVGAGTSCFGRADAVDGVGSENLQERFTGEAVSAAQLKYDIQTLGLSLREFVALTGVRALDGFALPGFAPFFARGNATLSNAFFEVLLAADWTLNGREYEAVVRGEAVRLTPQDLLLRTDPELQAHAQDYAADNALFVAEFKAAWTKLMNADRFDGPAGNACAVSTDAEVKAPAAVVV